MSTPEDGPPTVGVKSSRDLSALPGVLETWLAGKMTAGSFPRVTGLSAPSSTGMSTETVVFDADWADGDGEHHERLVARIPPDPADMPIFPVYDIPKQYRVMSKVRELTEVPVPELMWLEEDPSLLGQPFLVMRCVEGQVPPDNPPYTFGDNWLFDAPSAAQRRLQERTVAVLAGLHAAGGAESNFDFLQDRVRGDTPLRRLFQREIVDYYEWVSVDVRSPLLERGLRTLEDKWPSDEGPAALSWGDARIGNIMYRDFEPVAVLDWEMASLGPREVDVAWCQWFHEFFQGVVTGFGLAGMPGFMRRDDFLATYEKLTGHSCRDMDWYALLAAVRFGINALRLGLRGIHFGQSQMPDDVDELIFHRADMEEMISGTYWAGR